MQAFTATTLLSLSDPKEEWRYRLEMLVRAQQFVYASTYFLQLDHYGCVYVEALLKARARGVEITLLVDGFGQMLAGSLMTKDEKVNVKKAWQRLRDSGVNLVFYRCRNPLKRLLGSGMHIKIQLSEAGGAIFSSGNITAISYEKWHEYSVYVEGSIVTRLLQEFEDLGCCVPQEHKHRLARSVGQAGDVIQYISYNPVLDPHPLNPIYIRNPNAVTDYIERMIRQAQQRISLSSFYFKPAPHLTRALVDAARRGVKIEIFHSHRDALGPSIMPWIPCYHGYRELLDAGIHIYENHRGEHSKIILIDQKTAIFGSYNFEYAAHDRLAEAMMISNNAPFISSLEAVFDHLRCNSDNVFFADAMMALPKAIDWKVKLLKPISRWI